MRRMPPGQGSMFRGLVKREAFLDYLIERVEETSGEEREVEVLVDAFIERYHKKALKVFVDEVYGKEFIKGELEGEHRGLSRQLVYRRFAILALLGFYRYGLFLTDREFDDLAIPHSRETVSSGPRFSSAVSSPQETNEGIVLKGQFVAEMCKEMGQLFVHRTVATQAEVSRLGQPYRLDVLPALSVAVLTCDAKNQGSAVFYASNGQTFDKKGVGLIMGMSLANLSAAQLEGRCVQVDWDKNDDPDVWKQRLRFAIENPPLAHDFSLTEREYALAAGHIPLEPSSSLLPIDPGYFKVGRFVGHDLRRYAVACGTTLEALRAHHMRTLGFTVQGASGLYLRGNAWLDYAARAHDFWDERRRSRPFAKVLDHLRRMAE